MKNLLFFLSLSCLLPACKNKNDCAKTMCTMDYRMVTVKLLQGNGSDYIPEKTETYLDNGQLIHVQSSPTLLNENIYTVADDGDLNQFTLNQTSHLRFKIYQNGAVDTVLEYQILRDCCHVNKISGPAEVVFY